MAYFGTFGYELDITKLTEKELEQMKEQITFMKQHRDLIQKGEFYRLESPFKGNQAAWEVVAKDGSEGLMAYFRVRQPIQGKLGTHLFQRFGRDKSLGSAGMFRGEDRFRRSLWGRAHVCGI